MVLMPWLRQGVRWWWTSLVRRRDHHALAVVIPVVVLVLAAALQVRSALVLLAFPVLALWDLAWYLGRAGERTRWGLDDCPVEDGEPTPWWELPPRLRRFRVIRGGRR